jgi:hypothetical protein
MSSPVRLDRQDLPFVAKDKATTEIVDEAMVTSAQQAGIGKVRFAAVDPMHEVVAIAPVGRPVAAGEPAAAVADDQGAAEGGRDGASAPADVDGF